MILQLPAHAVNSAAQAWYSWLYIAHIVIAVSYLVFKRPNDD